MQRQALVVAPTGLPMIPVRRPQGLRLSLARLRFTARLDTPLDLGPFPGALLRSVFGAALRQGVCVTGRQRCEGCPLRATCSYPALFETPARDTAFAQRFSQVPNPYVIEPPPPGPLQPGEPLVFGMVLIGVDAQQRVPEVVQAWRRALQLGLGLDGRRSRGELLAVEVLDAQGTAGWVPVWGGQAAAARPAPLDRHWTLAQVRPEDPPEETPAVVGLHFHTPLRLQHQGQALRPEALSPRALVSHLLRRISLMLDLHLGVPVPPFDPHELVARADRLQDDRRALRWVSQPRYSARQGQAMDLAGAVGTWWLQGPVGPLLPWLRLGEWLHVGKNATMGHGGYSLDDGGSRIDGMPRPSGMAPGMPC